MSDRFDLEQEILECWKVVNDITIWADKNASAEDFKVLAAYYEHKFDKLWETFETCIKNKQIQHTSGLPKHRANSLRGVFQRVNIYMEPIQLTLADLASIRSIIEAASQRGAFKANELTQVGAVYDKLSAFLQASQAQLEAAAAMPNQPSGESNA